MGFNISNIGDVSGNAVGGGPDDWVFELDLSVPGNLTVSGDFDVTDVFTDVSTGEVDSLVVTSVTGGAFGTLDVDSDTGQWTFTVDYDAVMATGSDQVFYFEVTGYYDGTESDDDNVTINILICFCRGTRIKTPEGGKAVEDLQVGDLVMTKDNGAMPLIWKGNRKISPPELRLSPDLHPVRISKGALAKDKPKRDLLVSPNHQVLLSDWRAELLFGEREVLVPAKALVDNETILRDRNLQTVEYFHLMFEDHQIIYSEGTLTESFYPGQTSLRLLAPDIRYDLLTRFPELEEEGGYGEPARPSLSTWEGELLWEVSEKQAARIDVEDAA